MDYVQTQPQRGVQNKCKFFLKFDLTEISYSIHIMSVQLMNIICIKKVRSVVLCYQLLLM